MAAASPHYVGGPGRLLTVWVFFPPTFSDERETGEGGISDSVRSPWTRLSFSENILSLNCDVQSAL